MYLIIKYNLFPCCYSVRANMRKESRFNKQKSYASFRIKHIFSYLSIMCYANAVRNVLKICSKVQSYHVDG